MAVKSNIEYGVKGESPRARFSRVRRGWMLAVAAAFCACQSSAQSPDADRKLKVGVYADAGASGIGAVEWYRIVNDSPEMQLRLIDGAGVRAGELDGLDLLVMPGGDSKLQFDSLGLDGIDVLVVASDAAGRDRALAASIVGFASRGGKVVGFGSGRDALPEGGVVCEPRMGVVRTIKRMFADQ